MEVILLLAVIQPVYCMALEEGEGSEPFILDKNALSLTNIYIESPAIFDP